MKFKTNLKCSGCVSAVTPFMDAAVGKENWQVDLASPEKTVTVKDGAQEQKVKEAFQKAGYSAEKM